MTTAVTAETLAGWPLPRPESSEKHSRGVVLIVGGGAETPGAALLAAEAALRAGCGKARIATVDAVAAHLGVALPEARAFGFAQTTSGDLSRVEGRHVRLQGGRPLRGGSDPAIPVPMENWRMDLSPLGVRATAGTLRASQGVVLHHAWTDEGVVAAPAANGAQLLHLSVALCVLNDTYREAERLGIGLEGVAVEADGAFDDKWHSTGIEYSVTLDSRASVEDLARLSALVEEVAEIPRAIQAGAPVTRRT